ncbi:MAG: CoA transferase [Deltaproteobacteria bacterium]|nr:CoA transferase [Deltaproteobacteria bacterium]
MTGLHAAALEGRRVLDLAGASGAYCGKLLADMGADVVKIEPPGGAPERRTPPCWRDADGTETSFAFLAANTSKRSVTLDLERSAGRDVFLLLAASADLVIETFPPGTLEERGLGYEALRAVNPRIVLTSITGFGQTGPHRAYRSCDLVAGAVGGALYVTGEADDPPVSLAAAQSYVTASSFAAVSSLVALLHASHTGCGQHIDVSLQEAVASMTHICGAGKFLDDGIVPRRRGTGLFASVPSGAYPCKDGLVYLMVNRPHHWKALAEWIHEVTDNEEVLDAMFEGPSSRRQEYRELIDVFVSDLTQELTVAEAYHEGQRRRIAFTPVNTAARLVADPQLAARDYFVPLAHAGGATLAYPGAPYRHDKTPWALRGPAPRAGEHNASVYQGELGLTTDRIRALHDDGVV